jgi:futalosine hydrolase
MKTDSSILIVGAVFQEIAPIIEKLYNVQKISIGNRHIFCGTLFNQSLVIVQSGIGMLNAVQAVTAVIEKIPVHLIINTGCAGAFPNSGISIGDIGIATKETDIHFGIEGDSPENPVEQLSIPVIQTACARYYGSYPVSEHYYKMAHDILSKEFISKNIVVKLLPFITVSTITTSVQRINSLFNSYHAGMENMEGAGIAHVALHYNKPFLEIRAASNIVGERDKGKWKMTEAFERSTSSVLLLLKAFHI